MCVQVEAFAAVVDHGHSGDGEGREERERGQNRTGTECDEDYKPHTEHLKYKPYSLTNQIMYLWKLIYLLCNFI